MNNSLNVYRSIEDFPALFEKQNLIKIMRRIYFLLGETSPFIDDRKENIPEGALFTCRIKILLKENLKPSYTTIIGLKNNTFLFPDMNGIKVDAVKFYEELDTNVDACRTGDYDLGLLGFLFMVYKTILKCEKI